MPPKPKKPETVTPTSDAKPERTGKSKGITVNPEFNTNLPNYIYNPKYWRGDGRKTISVHYLLIYALLIDKVTKVNDGLGLVLGGIPLTFAVIRDAKTTEGELALGCSWSTVQRATKHLVNVGLIRRTEASMTDGYQYEVLNCRKTFTGKQADDPNTIKLKGKTYTRVSDPDVCPECNHRIMGNDPNKVVNHLVSKHGYIRGADNIAIPPNAQSFNVEHDELDPHCDCEKCEHLPF